MKLWPFGIHVNSRKGLEKKIKKLLQVSFENERLSLTRLLDDCKREKEEIESILDFSIFKTAKPYLQFDFDLTFNFLERSCKEKKTIKYVQSFLKSFYELDTKDEKKGFDLFSKLTKFSKLNIDELRMFSFYIIKNFNNLSSSIINLNFFKDNKKNFCDFYFKKQAHLDYILNLSDSAYKILELRASYLPSNEKDEDKSWQKVEDFFENNYNLRKLGTALKNSLSFYKKIIQNFKDYEKKYNINLSKI